MNILIGTHHLVEYGGTEAWVRTMAAALQAKGHAVDVWATQTGPAGEDLPLVAKPAAAYDLLLLNHNTVQRALAGVGGVKIATVHGPAHSLEKPLPGMEAYVAVSQEVLRALPDWAQPRTRLLNPVDTDRFAATPLPPGPPQILSLCKGLAARDRVGTVCARLGYGFDWVHYKEKPCADVAPLLQQATAVVSYGRGCYEALASGRHALVYDHRFVDGQRRHYGDGWLMPPTIEAAAWFNCSGRWHARPWSEDSLRYHLDEAFHALPDPGWGPRHIARHQRAPFIAQSYLNLYAAVRRSQDDRNQAAA